MTLSGLQKSCLSVALGLTMGSLAVLPWNLRADDPPVITRPVAGPPGAGADPRPPANPMTGTVPTANPGTATRPTLPAAASNGKKNLRLFLLEGSVVSGVLSVEEITVDTEFGQLKIPVNQIVSMTPGLDSHPEERKKITRLIMQLGSNVASEREVAQKGLFDFGTQIRPELEKYIKDEDAERRTRVQKILADLEEQATEDEESQPKQTLISQDTVETSLFTVVGKISPQKFAVQTQFGPLNIALADIRRSEHELPDKAEIRKNVNVSGANLAQTSWVSSGIKLNRGDVVNINADGSIVMTPWGNNVSSTPDGGENFQWFIPNQIPGGALVGKIGTNGPVFKVGSKNTFTATRSGVMHFAVAMNPQFATQGYNFPGEYHVKMRVNSK